MNNPNNPIVYAEVNSEEVREIRVMLKRLDDRIRALCEGEPRPATIVDPPKTSAMHAPDVFGCWVSFDSSVVGDSPEDDGFKDLVEDIATLEGVYKVIVGQPNSYAIEGGYGIHTVRDLKLALRDVPDNLPVKVHAYKEEGDLSVEGPITSIGVGDESFGTDDSQALIIGSSHFSEAAP